MNTSNNNRLKYLVDRCINKLETEAERHELNIHLRDEQLQENIDEVFLESFFQPKELIDLPTDKQHQILQAIFSIDNKKQPSRIISYWKWASAAAILTAVFLSAIWIGNEKQTSKISHIDTKNEINNKNSPAKTRLLVDSQPIKEMAVLEMENGSRVELGRLDSGKMVNNGSLGITRIAEGMLLLSNLPHSPKNQSHANTINTIKTPRGTTYKIILTDGTMVHMNSDSKLSFPATFGNNERKVTLEGEAYFDVTKDRIKQFVVSSNIGKYRQEIRVYGTEFNVSAYPGEKSIKTVLVEGSVSIKELSTGTEILMKPNEMVEMDQMGLAKQPIDLESTLAWKSNNFYFAHKPIEEVLKQISRWYDIKVIYDKTIPSEFVWGQISRKKKLNEVLEILEKSNNIKFKIKGKEVHVMP